MFTDFRGRLDHTNFQDAMLELANFQGANLQFANFQNADLIGALFQGADLENANLQGAKLKLLSEDSHFTYEFTLLLDENTILPDGTKWATKTDMARFTDPDHLDFWRSNDPDSPAYLGQ